MEYKLLADSGSTKTDWLLLGDGEKLQRFSTQGINPFMLGNKEIVSILQKELLRQMPDVNINVIEFYGAGCRGTQCNLVADALQTVFHPQQVVVDSDMLGAARALCGAEEGIVCILGTGSNSCLYDGHAIIANVSPLGYILGDEGSGAVLGRRLIGDVLKLQLPENICHDFYETYGLTGDAIIQKVYRESLPNRFLASFAPFLHQHREEECIHRLLLDEFDRFFRRNVANYHREDLHVHFVGSIAYYFQNELKESALRCGFHIGKIQKAPLDD